MIGSLAQRVGTGERPGYATELAGLWSEVSRTLRRLESIAARPEEQLASDDAPEELARLRYTLHLAGERAYGLSPPPGVEAPHEELAAALDDARDATAEVAEAVEAAGADGGLPLVYEWRGALFRVRLARMRLAAPRPRHSSASAEEERPALLAPLLSFGLVGAGAAAFVLGAMLAAWPVWALGMLALVAGLLAYRP